MEIGNKYNRLLIIKEVGKIGYQRCVKCKCDCGNIKDIRLSHLKNGKAKSCGCFNKEQTSKTNTTHGMRQTIIYRIWSHIKTRCNNKNIPNYKNYGGRGISYDPKWETFEGFYKDMKYGYKDGLSIDREDNDGNYCKSNCKWSTPKQQARNRRSNITYKGKCISQWCEELGINYPKVMQRINKLGWPIEKALKLIIE